MIERWPGQTHLTIVPRSNEIAARSEAMRDAGDNLRFFPTIPAPFEVRRTIQTNTPLPPVLWRGHSTVTQESIAAQERRNFILGEWITDR